MPTAAAGTICGGRGAFAVVVVVRVGEHVIVLLGIPPWALLAKQQPGQILEYGSGLSWAKPLLYRLWCLVGDTINSLP